MGLQSLRGREQGFAGLSSTDHEGRSKHYSRDSTGSAPFHQCKTSRLRLIISSDGQLREQGGSAQLPPYHAKIPRSRPVYPLNNWGGAGGKETVWEELGSFRGRGTLLFV